MANVTTSTTSWRLERNILPGTRMKPMTFNMVEDGTAYVIGRYEANSKCPADLPLSSGYVSKQHCKIGSRNGIWYITDLGSLNGTFLNKKKIEKDIDRELREYDVIGLGIAALYPGLAECNTGDSARDPKEPYFEFTFSKVGSLPAQRVSKNFEAHQPSILPKGMISNIKIEVITLDDNSASDEEEREKSRPCTKVEEKDHVEKKWNDVKQAHREDIKGKQQKQAKEQQQLHTDSNKGNSVDQNLQKQTEEKQRREAEEKQKREAEEKERREAEKKLKREAEEKQKREAEEKQRREAEEKQKREAEKKMKREAEEKQKREAEEKQKREAEEKQKREAEEKQKREAEEKQKREAEEKQKREAEEKQKREAEEKQKREGEEKQRQEAEEKQKREAEKKMKREAEETRRREAQDKQKIEAEEKRKRDIRERQQKDAEEMNQREVEEMRREVVEQQLQKEALELQSSIPTTQIEPRSTNKHLLKKVRSSTCCVLLSPVLYFSETGTVSIRISKNERNAISPDSLARAVSQFEQSLKTTIHSPALNDTVCLQSETVGVTPTKRKTENGDGHLEPSKKKPRNDSFSKPTIPASAASNNIGPTPMSESSHIGHLQTPLSSAIPKKDLNKVINKVYQSHGIMETGKTKMLNEVPIAKSRRQAPFSSVPPVRKSFPPSKFGDDKTPCAGMTRSEKLHMLALSKKNTEPISSLRPAPGPSAVKTKITKLSRADLLLNSMEPKSSTQYSKPTTAVAPLPAERFKNNPVDRIIQEAANNNLEHMIYKKPTSHNLRPTASSYLKQKGERAIETGVVQPLFSRPPADGNTSKPNHSNHASLSGSTLPTTNASVSGVNICIPREQQATANAAVTCVTPAERLDEDQVYRDILNWNPQWLEDQGPNTAAPPVCHGQPVLTNLPMYKNYESYKNTFYPLMILELWASLIQDYNSKENTRHRQRNDRSLSSGSCELPVAIESIDSKYACPLLAHCNQPNHNARRQEVKYSTTTSESPFYHLLRLVALVDQYAEFNRDRDFGIVTLDFRTETGGTGKCSFFAFFQEPQCEEITSMTILPQCLQPHLGSKKIKVILPVVAHIKLNIDKIIRDNVVLVRKICYISSKVRDFRALAQLPDSNFFPLILSPPFCGPEGVISKSVAPRSELVAVTHEMLNSVQRSIVYHISRRVVNGSGADLMLLHGPPGTGKTKTIVGLILQLTMDYRNRSQAADKQIKILVCTPSNTAVDEIIRRLVHYKEGLRIVRIGGNSISPDTKQFLLQEVAKPYMSQAGQVQSIDECIRGIDKKIETAKAQIQALKAGCHESKNKTEIFSLEEQIVGLGRDRKMYVSDLNTLYGDKKRLEKAKRDVILKSQVVFSTLNSCSSGQLRRQFKSSLESGRRGLEGLNEDSLFTCCIVDEATQATEPETLAPLMLGCEKLILVGDPKQLPATVLSAEAESKKFRQSLFTRMFNHYEDKAGTSDRNPVMMLTIQYRMHREILKWPNDWFYGKRLQTHESVDARPQLRVRPYLFLNVPSKESNTRNGQISNDEEVKLLKAVLMVLKVQSTIDTRHKNLSIGIITPYNEQRKKVCCVVDQLRQMNPQFANTIEVDTIDSFQGREKDIILLSCVRSTDLGFIKTPERLNVALTRAKQSQIIVGNAACLRTNVMWKSLMDDAMERKRYESLPEDFSCQRDVYLQQLIEKMILGS